MKNLIIGLCCLVAFATVEAKDWSEPVSTDHTVLFDTDKSEISNDSVKKLQEIELRDSQVTIIGHADERGSNKYNIALGMRRANSVASVLGLSDASVSSVGENHATGDMPKDRNVLIRVTSIEYNPIFGGYDVIMGPVHHLQYGTIPQGMAK